MNEADEPQWPQARPEGRPEARPEGRPEGRPQARLDPLPLDLLGIAELEAYILELKAEIQRVAADIAVKQSHRKAAEAFFKAP
jgi:uncharacterized small protein (DUF1192 family)